MTIDRRTLLLASVAALLPTGTRAARDTPSPETVDYGPAKLDIYAPDGAKDLPVVFFVHGGAWRTGKRSQVNAKPAFLLANGFCFVSIDYRMLPQADVAIQAGDVERAYAYVRTNIAQHGGDPNRIVGMGHSAGCHLIALTGMRGGLPGVAGLLLDDTRAYDLAALAGSGGMVRAYSRAFSDPSQWAALSPASYVNGPQASADLHRLFPRRRSRRAVHGLCRAPARQRNRGDAVRRQRLYPHVDQPRFRRGRRRADRCRAGVPEIDGRLSAPAVRGVFHSLCPAPADAARRKFNSHCLTVR
ncbi:alpha/beta hydrolase [Mesorhizobium sp. CO1-1-2]